MSTLDPQFMLEAMRAGVNECLAEPLTREAIDEAVRGVRRRQPAGARGPGLRVRRRQGRRRHDARSRSTPPPPLRRQTKGTALLVDLHLVHGDAALFFGVGAAVLRASTRSRTCTASTSRSSADWSRRRGPASTCSASSQPADPRRDAIRSGTRTLLEFATRKYPFTVLDVPRSDFAMLDALDPVTTIVVVTSQEVSSLRSATHTAETLRQRYGAARVRVVLNRFDKNAAVGHQRHRAGGRRTVKHQIPSDYRVAVEAVNTGVPLVLGDSKLAKVDAVTGRRTSPAWRRTRRCSRRLEASSARLAWRRV